MNQDNEYFDKLSYHLIKYLSQFLTVKDNYQLSLTNKAIKESIGLKMKCIPRKNKTEAHVRDNGINLYLEVDV